MDTQIPGVYREMQLGFTEFRLTDAIPRISAPVSVVQEVAALLQQHEEFMIITNLKVNSQRSGTDTVFSLEDKNSGKAILAFWTDAKRRKLGLKVLTNAGREKGVPFKHLNIHTEQWYNIVARIFKKQNSNDTHSAVELFINCESVGTLNLHSRLPATVQNRSLRLLLGQRGRGDKASWSKWNVSEFYLRCFPNIQKSIICMVCHVLLTFFPHKKNHEFVDCTLIILSCSKAIESTQRNFSKILALIFFRVV